MAYTTALTFCSRNYFAVSYAVPSFRSSSSTITSRNRNTSSTHRHPLFGGGRRPVPSTTNSNLSYYRGGSSSSPMPSLTMASTTTAAADAASPSTTATSIESCPKLDALRQKMKELNIDAYIIPSDDPHLSEYVPESYTRRAFLSGFKGSAGTAVVTAQNAYLWTDSRYVFVFGLGV